MERSEIRKIKSNECNNFREAMARSKATLNRYPLRSLDKFPPHKKPRKRKCGCEFPRTFPEIRCQCYQQKIDDSKDIPPLVHEKALRSSHQYALAALSYLSKQGHDYELVLPDYYGVAVVGGGVRFHHNFKAKRANDPNAPVETFFSQLFHPKGFGENRKELIVECCVSLGNSDSLPKKCDNFGCAYCSMYVYHPVGGCEGIIWGTEDD